MKYQFKDKELFDALSVIFGKEYVDEELQRQMSDDAKCFYLQIDKPEGIKSIVKISKDQIECVKEDFWHPFPENKPEKDGVYLVSVKNLVGDEPYMMFLTWDHTKKVQWTDVIAFRQAPKPYRPIQRWRIKDPQTRRLMSRFFGDDFVSRSFEEQKDNNLNTIQLSRDIAVHPTEPTVTRTIHTWVDKKDFESY